MIHGNPKVEKFIQDFVTLFGQFQQEEIDTVSAVFSRGFCYYFAIILKEAFDGRGEIYMTRDNMHIVWVLDNVAYDINGVFQVYSRSANNGNFYHGELIPIAMLPNYISSFKHVVPGTTKKGMVERQSVRKLMEGIEKAHKYKTISINGIDGRVICENDKIAKLSSRKEDDNDTKWSD